MNKEVIFSKITQFAIPILTISSQIAISFKNPKAGLAIGMAVQPFWLYASYKSYKNASQIGIFVTTIIMAVLITFGFINYWFIV